MKSGISIKSCMDLFSNPAGYLLIFGWLASLVIFQAKAGL
jgi:hypothetical protein